MKIEFHSGKLEELAHRCLVVLANKDGVVLNGTPAMAELLAPFAASGEFGKSSGDEVYLINPPGIQAERLMFVNVGKSVKKAHDLRKATGKAWKSLRNRNINSLLISLEGFSEDEVRAVVEGFLMSNYQYQDLKTDKKELPIQLAQLALHGGAQWQEKIGAWKGIFEGTARARDLSQMPPNVLYPESLAELAVTWGETFGYTTTVLREKDMKALGMGCLLAVAQGSARSPKMVIMEYTPEKPSGKTFALVGKAVTFDSGGISLKPSKGMGEMKGDMGGGAAVIGAMTALKAAGCPHRVIGVVPSVENMPSSTATRPSDVVTSLSGVTVEINNTDAEGRLILADALTYVARYEPDYVVDFATLTGACLVALGSKVYAVMGNHQPLVDAILEAGNEVNEPFWQLPLVEEYKELLDSATADISNISSSSYGGTITAGLFLERFAGKFQWAHCDIAAAIFEKSDELNPSGGNGAGVRMILNAMSKF